jgi:hypothetical protein
MRKLGAMHMEPMGDECTDHRDAENGEQKMNHPKSPSILSDAMTNKPTRPQNSKGGEYQVHAEKPGMNLRIHPRAPR